MVFFREVNFNKKRRTMKKIVVFFGIVFCVMTGNAFSESYQFGLSANGNVVMANFEMLNKRSFGTIAAGGVLSLARGDYTIGEAMLALRNDQLLPGLRYGLGFKALYGKVDEEGGAYHGMLSALGFLGEVAYELNGSINPINIPVEAYAGLCFAPSSLCVDDTEKYQEYKGGLRFYLLESAFISAELKYRRIDFHDTVHGNWGRDDTFVTGGLTLRF
jgi:hypothetical protein